MGHEPQSAVAIHNLQADAFHYISHPLVGSHIPHPACLPIYTKDKIRGAVKKFRELLHVNGLVHREFVPPARSAIVHFCVRVSQKLCDEVQR
jgi:hypothetical protein